MTIDRPDAITRQGASRGTGGDADSGRIRVLIADDHAIVRKGLCALLATEPDIEVIGEAQDGHEVIAEAQKLHPDVILMDLVMPCMNGLEATWHITAHNAQDHQEWSDKPEQHQKKTDSNACLRAHVHHWYNQQAVRRTAYDKSCMRLTNRWAQDAQGPEGPAHCEFA
jgi:CheY-like chemotaxis protein